MRFLGLDVFVLVRFVTYACAIFDLAIFVRQLCFLSILDFLFFLSSIEIQYTTFHVFCILVYKQDSGIIISPVKICAALFWRIVLLWLLFTLLIKLTTSIIIQTYEVTIFFSLI